MSPRHALPIGPSLALLCTLGVGLVISGGPRQAAAQPSRLPEPAAPVTPTPAPAPASGEGPAVLRPPQTPAPNAVPGESGQVAPGSPRAAASSSAGGAGSGPGASSSSSSAGGAGSGPGAAASGNAAGALAAPALAERQGAAAGGAPGEPSTEGSPVEPAISGPPAAPAPVPEALAFSWQPFGFLRGQLGVVRDDPDVAFVGRSDGFSLQNARLGVRGELGDRVAFEVSIDGAVDERERVNTTNGRLRVGLRDAFVDFHRLAAPLGSSFALSLRAGRFESWFDPDDHDGDTERAFVDRALESRGIAATEGWETAGLPPGRSLGVALRAPIYGSAASGSGEERLALWAEVAAQNGADEFASGNDNDAVALSAALRLVAQGRGWLQAAARRNPRTEGDLPFQQEEVDTALSLGGGLSLGPVRAAAGGVLQYTSFETTGGPRQRAWGAHGQALVRAWGGSAPLEVGYRFAVLDPSSLVVSDRLMEHTVGLVVPFEALRTRVQLNATHVAEQDERQLTNDRVELVVELRL